MQVDLMKPMLKPPGTKRVKLKYNKLLSSFAFKLCFQSLPSSFAFKICFQYQLAPLRRGQGGARRGDRDRQQMLRLQKPLLAVQG